MPISWDHLKELYTKNRAQADDTGLALIPKLKFEHIYTLQVTQRCVLTLLHKYALFVCYGELKASVCIHIGSQQLSS